MCGSAVYNINETSVKLISSKRDRNIDSYLTIRAKNKRLVNLESTLEKVLGDIHIM